MAALSGVALAQASTTPVETALSLCADLPDDIQTARETLLAGGWQISERAPAVVLFNAVASFNFDANDLTYTFDNAGFMAASILGNSALGPDQIGMEAGDHMLAVLGIPEGSPYCVMTGPAIILEQLQGLDGFNTITEQSTDVLQQGSATYGDGLTVAIGSFDLPAINGRLSDADLPADYISRLLTNLAPATVHIVSSEVQQ